MSAQQPSQAPEGSIPEEAVIKNMGNSLPLDMSDMLAAPDTGSAADSEEAIVHSLLAAAHATIAKVDSTIQKTRMLKTKHPP